ncbi:beta-ketoacyl synthase chain length factor [Acidisoma cladoniae]|uniref:beta-ketoacyl synthase chain length factor n=1 Tax=Acidisoma cladoniae TaxID=3040935 RepID=UPI0025503DB2|nr:beta-ketoacyl synthase chain length factor [Acidisoma sp. PAMC 29798]
MSRAFIASVGLRGPGLAGWAQGAAVLRGDIARSETSTEIPMTTLLAPNERRRAGLVTRLALAVAEEAMTNAGLPLNAARGVFGSANGDAPVVLNLLEALAEPGRPLSPTQFHNSVHNAVAGYWSIAADSGQPITCLGGYDATFGVALLKSVCEVAAEQVPVLLCLYDVPLPWPLALPVPNAESFAVGFVLLPERPEHCLGTVTLGYAAEPAGFENAAPRGPGLAAMARANPAALSLRLLEALATGQPDRFALPMLDGRVTVAVEP